MLTLIDRKGPLEAMICPAFLCDVCMEPISSRGWAAWRPEYPEDDRPVIEGVYTVHGRPTHDCLNKLEEQVEGRLYTLLLEEVVEKLAHNLTHPFDEDPDLKEGRVEYVAPSPSTWRTGSRG